MSQDQAKVYYLFPPTGHEPPVPTVELPPVAPVVSFDEYLLGRGLAEKTVSDYMREVRWALAWFDAQNLDLADAVPSQLIEYADTRPNTPSVRAHLRSALRYWWEWREVQGWPDAIRVPTNRPMVCKALDDSDIHAMVNAARGWWKEGTAVLCMAYLALRNKEVAGLRWDGFDDPMEWYTLVGKGNKTRTIPVHPVLVRELQEHRNDYPYAFPGRAADGKTHISHATISNWVNKVALKAGVKEKVWPHRLRHTTLAMMNDNTKDLRTTQAFAGHSRPETTSGYTRATAKNLRAASDALDF